MPEGGGTDNRRSALLDLLDRPVVQRAAQAEAYRRVYLHEDYLRAWFQDRPGWRLLGGDGSYRLERLPAQVLPDRGLPRLRTPLDYACLCWVLWYAEARAVDPKRWFVLSELAAEVVRAAAGAFRLGERAHREALVRALQLLVDLGALVYRDGQAERWATGQVELGDDAIEVLYEFADDAPRLLAAFDPAGLDVLGAPPTDGPALPRTGEPASPQARAWRALLLGPTLWRGDDPEAFVALLSDEEGFRRDLEDTLGWGLEVAAEYARIWRNSAARGAGASVLLDLVAEDADGPVDRHIRYVFHPILLLLGAVRAEVEAGRLTASEDGTLALQDGMAHDLFLAVCRRYRRNWGSELGDQMGAEQVWERLARQMRQMGFLRGPDAMGRIWLLPTSAHLIGAYVTAARTEDADAGPRTPPSPSATERSLFDGAEVADWSS